MPRRNEVLIPVQAYLTSGAGVHREQLVAFELALRDAGIAAQNLVTVSSILPPQCELISRAEGEELLQSGQILHVVLSREESDDPGAALGASIGIARPADRSHHGFIAEHGVVGTHVDDVCAHAEDLAITMLASTLGVEIDEDLDANGRARVLNAEGHIEHHDSICSVARGDADGRWTVVVAAAILIMDWMIPKNA